MGETMANSESFNYCVRLAGREDCAQIMGLVRELAEYDNFADQLLIGTKELERDGFCDNPWFKCVVTECTDSEDKRCLVGYTLFYYVYSTFQGRSAYLEDFYVRPSHRSQGLGKQMLQKVSEIVLAAGCCRMDYVVFSWNKRAIDLYKRLGAQNLTEKEQWNLWRLEGEQLRAIAAPNKP